MTVAHTAVVAPRRSGLSETVTELVRAERAAGLDARIVNMGAEFKGDTIGPVPIAGMDWATTADVVCSHSGHEGTPFDETDQPIVVCAHGRPESAWRIEQGGGSPIVTYHVTRHTQPRLRSCVTFWPEYEAFYRPIWAPKPVFTVPAMVDLSYWSPGPTDYAFLGRAGDTNVVMSDAWARSDTSVASMLAAFNLFRHMAPGAKLHLYAVETGVGAAARAALGSRLSAWLGDSLGVVQGRVADLRPIYRAADLVITPHQIATRIVREAMACGTPVVSGADVDPWNLEAFALNMVRRLEQPGPVRAMAEALFAPERAAAAMAPVLEHARSGVAVGH